MNYWLDLFTGTTWNEFRQAGTRITGFRSTTKGISKQVKPGDIFVCYLTGVMRWVGALEVLGTSLDRTRIWQFDAFPVRFEVRPLVILDPEHGVPMADLEGKVAFFSGPKDRGKFNGFVRRSPNRFQRAEDGALVLDLLRRAESQPVPQPWRARGPNPVLTRVPLHGHGLPDGLGRTSPTFPISTGSGASTNTNTTGCSVALCSLASP